MKKLILLPIISASIYADTLVSTTSLFISNETSEKRNIMEIQPIDELVGKDGKRLELRLGKTLRQYGYINRFRLFTYLYNNSEKLNETGLGVGFHINFKSNSDLRFYYAGFAGFGKQNNKGTVKVLSTNVNKVSFIDDSADNTPTEVTFEKANTVFEYGFSIGSNYQITKNLTFDLGYVYRNKVYEVSYRQTNSVVLNSLTVDQNIDAIQFGITWNFDSIILF